MESRLIRDVIKHRPIVAVTPETSVREASQLMTKHRIGAVVVIGQSGQMTGIFTERDGLCRVLAGSLDPDTTRVEQVMTRDVTTVPPTRELLYALHLMQENSFRHLPVVDDGVPMGMLSLRDALDFELVHFLRDIEKKECLTEIMA